MAIPTYDNRELDVRGLLPSTIKHFSIERTVGADEGVFWQYPTTFPDGSLGPLRRKFKNPEMQSRYGRRPLRYGWANASEPDKPTTYNLSSVLDVLSRDPQTPVWLVGGEVEVWLFHQAKIPAFCILPLTQNPEDVGEGIDEAFARLKTLESKNIHIFPASNSEDRRLIGRIQRASQQHYLPVLYHEWAYTIPSPRYDLADFWVECERDGLRFENSLSDLGILGKDKLKEYVEANRQWEKERRQETTSLALATGLTEHADPEESDQEEEFGDYFGRMSRITPAGKLSSEDQMLRILNLLSREPALDVKLWKTTENELFLSLMWQGRREVYNIESENFEYLIDRLGRDKLGIMMTKTAIDVAKFRFKAMANEMGKEARISPRIDGGSGRIYIDLHTKNNDVVEIGEGIDGGWRVTTQYQGIFRRAPGEERLPRPVRGDNRETWREFKELFNPGSETNWVLMIGWLFGCVRPAVTPYAGLAVSGEQDSGKSVRTKMLRMLIDPNTRNLGPKPTDERTLAIAAQNSFVLGYENLSGIELWLSDAFCRIATDGTFATRKLRTDDEEKIFSARRPLLFNGIDSLLGRPDLRRRLIFIDLPRLEQKKKIGELELWPRFNELRPRVLGALCDAAALALAKFKEMPNVNCGSGLVDFDRWVRAGEEVLPWETGLWHPTYLRNLGETAMAGAQAPFPAAVVQMMKDLKEKEGKDRITLSTKDLSLRLLTYGAMAQIDDEEYFAANDHEKRRLFERAVEQLKREKSFPTDAVWCGRALKRDAAMLREIGIDSKNDSYHGRWTLWNIAVEQSPEGPSYVNDDVTQEKQDETDEDRIRSLFEDADLTEGDPFRD